MAVFLNNGKRLTGRVRSFDTFTLLLETGSGEQIIFKHAIATVGPQASGAGRDKERFANRMNMGSLKPAAIPSAGAVEKPQAPAATSRAREDEPSPE
ncbi:MAG: RNA chaperone Hfq [Acidobacteriota bacterium]